MLGIVQYLTDRGNATKGLLYTSRVLVSTSKDQKLIVVLCVSVKDWGHAWPGDKYK